jgi:hypothetical protein
MRALQTAELNNDDRALAICAVGRHFSEAQRSKMVGRYVNTLRSSAYSSLFPRRDLEALLAFHLPESERAEAIANNIRTLVGTAGEAYSPFVRENWKKHEALLSLLDDCVLAIFIK